jgi:hypothetical protein
MTVVIVHLRNRVIDAPLALRRRARLPATKRAPSQEKGSDITVDAIVQLKMTDRAAYHRYQRAGAQGVVLLAKGFTSGG